MAILVTGGAGFIGGHLCKYLLEQGSRVICVDNISTGAEKNISELFGNENFVFLKHDIINPLNINEKIDQIYNLACPASPAHYQINPIETIKINTVGVINMLDLAHENKARILQASTSEIYGDPLVHPQDESYRGNVSTTGPRACYDEGKRMAETLFFDYRRRYSLDIRVARIFNTYGPGMAKNDGRVVSNFIMQALNNIDITIYGTGGQTRSFCYVSDTVKGLFRLMNAINFIGPVNLGNPAEITILEMANKILALTNSGSKLVFEALPEDDPRKRKPDITLAKRKLNWEPAVDLESGLKNTINYFRQAI